MCRCRWQWRWAGQLGQGRYFLRGACPFPFLPARARLRCPAPVCCCCRCPALSLPFVAASVAAICGCRVGVSNMASLSLPCALSCKCSTSPACSVSSTCPLHVHPPHFAVFHTCLAGTSLTRPTVSTHLPAGPLCNAGCTLLQTSGESAGLVAASRSVCCMLTLSLVP